MSAISHHQPAEPASRSSRRLLLVAALVFAGIVSFHLLCAHGGYPFYRDQHIGTAIDYSTKQIDFLRPIIPGYNATNTPTPLEPPVWQVAAALMFKALGPWWGWANVTALAFFALGLWPLHRLAAAHLGERGAAWTLVCFLCQPVVIVNAGAAATDGLAIVASIWFLYFADRMLREESWRLFPAACVTGAFSATMKLPFFASVALASIFLIFVHGAASRKRWLTLALTGVVSTAVFAVWNAYTNRCYALAEYPFWDMRVGVNPEMWRFYFGDWESRLNLKSWATGGWRALNCVWGSFALLIAALWALVFGKNRLGAVWFCSAFVPVLIFSNLILVHRHYFLLFSAPAAILLASAALKIEEIIGAPQRGRIWLAEAGMIAALLLASVQGLIGTEIALNFDPNPHATARVLRKHTTPDDKVLLFGGGGWGANELILANLPGLTVDHMKMLNDPKAVARLRELGFTKLAMLSESMLLHQLQVTNPGSARRQRRIYQQYMTPTVEAWPTLYQSDDLIIKSLP